MSQEPEQRPASSVVLKPQRLPECGPHLGASEICEMWFWDGDFGHMLGSVQGQEERWLVEMGVMIREDGWHDGAKELIVGDVVYRIRTAVGLEMGMDPREDLFEWFYVDVLTGSRQPRSKWYDLGTVVRKPEFVPVSQFAGRAGRGGSAPVREPGDDS